MTIASGNRCNSMLLRQAVWHSDAVLTCGPTYWPNVPALGILITVSNFAGTRLRCVLQRLQHSQPTVFSLRRLLSMLPTESQSNQPITFLVADFDGSIYEQSMCASEDLCNTLDLSPERCQMLSVRGVLWLDKPHCSPSAMSAAALTHCAKTGCSSHISVNVWDGRDGQPRMNKAYSCVVYK